MTGQPSLMLPRIRATVFKMDNAMMFYKPRAGLNALHGVTWAIRLRRPLFRSGGSRENVASRGLDDTLLCPWFAYSSLRSECRLSTYCGLGRYKRCGSIPQAKNPAIVAGFFCERNTRFEPEAAPRPNSRLQRYPRRLEGGCPSGAMRVARPNHRTALCKPKDSRTSAIF